MHRSTKALFCSLLLLLAIVALVRVHRYAPAAGAAAAARQTVAAHGQVLTQRANPTALRDQVLTQRAQPDAPPEGVSQGDWQGIRATYEQGRRRVFAVAEGHQARHPGQRWLTRFDGRGFAIEPEGGAWRWGLELRGYGVTGHERQVGSKARVTTEGERVAYMWDETLEEWFVNDERGLEHGFTIKEWL